MQWVQPFHPAFQVRLHGGSPVGEARDYRRSVDFTSGVVEAECAGWRSRVFVSRADDVIVQYVTGDTGLTLDIDLDHRLPGAPPGWASARAWCSPPRAPCSPCAPGTRQATRVHRRDAGRAHGRRTTLVPPGVRVEGARVRAAADPGRAGYTGNGTPRTTETPGRLRRPAGADDPADQDAWPRPTPRPCVGRRDPYAASSPGTPPPPHRLPARHPRPRRRGDRTRAARQRVAHPRESPPSWSVSSPPAATTCSPPAACFRPGWWACGPATGTPRGPERSPPTPTSTCRPPPPRRPARSPKSPRPTPP